MAELRLKYGCNLRREISTWSGMIWRCTSPKFIQFKDYGGRGIKVCKRWMKFENFLEDMGLRPAGKTLDRFPNTNGDYEPGNCRWATLRQQQHNARRAARGTPPQPLNVAPRKNAVDIAGMRFGRLVAVRATHRSSHRLLYWLCKCDCGGERVARQDNLRAGLSKHCSACPTEALA